MTPFYRSDGIKNRVTSELIRFADIQTVVRPHWLRLFFSKAVCERRLRSVNGPTVCFQVATSFPTLEQTVKANKVESPLKTSK